MKRHVGALSGNRGGLFLRRGGVAARWGGGNFSMKEL